MAKQQAEQEIRFEDMAKFTDREIQLMLQQVDLKDVIVALKGARKAVKDRVLSNLSRRLAERVEKGLASAVAQDEVDRVRRVWMKSAADLRTAGKLNWPPVKKKPAARKPKRSKEHLAMKRAVRAALKRPLSALDFDDLNQVFMSLTDIARTEGILALEALEPHIANEFIKSGVRMAIDGSNPEEIREMHRLWMASLLREHQVKHEKILEGILSVQAGDNPVFTKAKLEKIF